MPSPFPGMGPSLEAEGLWESCHAAMVTHSDAMLNLRAVFDMTYDRGRYRRMVRYGKPLPTSLPLTTADREWSESLGR
jgi:hypothetical protein